MRIESQRDFWAGAMFFAIGAFFAVGSRHYHLGTSAQPGPGYFPLLLSIATAILGLVILAKSLTIRTSDGEPVGHIDWRPLLIITGSVVAFGLLLPLAGLGVAMFVLVAGSAMAGPAFRWREVIITSLLIVAFCWLVFIWGLGLPIPMWPMSAIS